MAKVQLEDGYVPSDDEPFMNDRQREYFRRKLLSWKNDILREAQDTLVALQSENENHPDLADRASSETDRAIELRARDRQRKLTGKIDAALRSRWAKSAPRAGKTPTKTKTKTTTTKKAIVKS